MTGRAGSARPDGPGWADLCGPAGSGAAEARPATARPRPDDAFGHAYTTVATAQPKAGCQHETTSEHILKIKVSAIVFPVFGEKDKGNLIVYFYAKGAMIVRYSLFLD